jgi:hypothetical protein
LEYFRKRAEAVLDPIVTAQLEAGMGAYEFLAQTETGFVRVTDPAVMDRYIAQGTGFKVWRRLPDVRALKDTLDRTCGKPSEHVEVTGTVDHRIQVLHKHLPVVDAKVLTS